VPGHMLPVFYTTGHLHNPPRSAGTHSMSQPAADVTQSDPG